MRFETILVAIDFSEPSTRAAEWIGQRFPSSRFVLVSVVEPPPPAPSLAHRFPSAERLVEDARGEALKKLQDLSRGIPRPVSDVRVGRPHQQILESAAEHAADLIVVGRQDVGAAGFARIGAIGQRLLRSSTKPILVVPGDPPHAISNVLAAIDDSPATSSVLTVAAKVGEIFTAETTAVHVLTSSRSPDEVEATKAWLDQWIAALGAGAHVNPIVVSGPRRASEGILAEARAQGSDLIIIGNHGAGSIEGESFGSVAESVLVSADRPVLVVGARTDT